MMNIFIRCFVCVCVCVFKFLPSLFSLSIAVYTGACHLIIQRREYVFAPLVTLTDARRCGTINNLGHLPADMLARTLITLYTCIYVYYVYHPIILLSVFLSLYKLLSIKMNNYNNYILLLL